MLSRKATAIVLALLVATFVADAAPDFSTMLRWRNIGPFRGGRVRAICGVPSQPNVFYFAQVNGGVFKTTDYGRSWQPIFDDQPTGSVGAIAVSVSDPNVIYVGSGEGLQRPDLSVGDGIYKSTDGGKTWQHLGLRTAQQIGAILVDQIGAPAAAARVCNVLTFPSAMVFTNQPTAARPGNTSDFARRNRSARSSSIHAIRISFTSRRSAILIAPTKSAACFVRLTAARTGRRFFTKTRTPARSRPHSIRQTRRSSTPICGLPDKVRGRTAHGKDRAVVSTKQLTAATTGANSRMVCQRSRKVSDASASPSRRAIQKPLTPRSMPLKVVAFIVRTTAVKRGNSAPTIAARGHAAATSAKSRSIQRTKRSSTPRPSQCTNPWTAARRGSPSKARPAATITTPSGSIQTIRRSCCPRWTRARSLR